MNFGADLHECDLGLKSKDAMSILWLAWLECSHEKTINTEIIE